MTDNNKNYNAACLESDQVSRLQSLESELRNSTDDDIVVIAYNKK